MVKKTDETTTGWHESGIADKLGVGKRLALLAVAAGMRYPLPQWYTTMSPLKRRVHRVFYTAVEMSLTILIASNLTLLIQEGPNDIGTGTECFGSLLFLFFGIGKSQLVYTKRNQLEDVMNKLHKVAEQLHTNPVGNKNYLKVHNKNNKLLQLYCEGKLIATAITFALVVINVMIPAMIHPDPKSETPMRGTFPLDYSYRSHFLLVCALQYFYYTLIGLRDIYADMTVLLILSTVNSQLIYLAELLEDIVGSKGSNHNKYLKFWAAQHQQALSILTDFRDITGPVLFLTYSNVSIFFFLLLVRLTEDPNFIILQQLAIIIMTGSNLVHLYIVSYIGDDMAANSLAVADAVETPSLWDLTKDNQLTVLQAAVRSTRPSYIIFGDNRKLCASSFGDICTAMFSYFNTMYQLRN